MMMVIAKVMNADRRWSCKSRQYHYSKTRGMNWSRSNGRRGGEKRRKEKE